MPSPASATNPEDSGHTSPMACRKYLRYSICDFGKFSDQWPEHHQSKNISIPKANILLTQAETKGKTSDKNGNILKKPVLINLGQSKDCRSEASFKFELCSTFVASQKCVAKFNSKTFIMEELIEKLKVEAGLSDEQAKKAIEAIKSYVVEKFPMLEGAVGNLFGN
jgi:hypothetical protein